ncbi:MAG: hypothetical protein CMB16_00340 [Euryarchaeota archaeon]|jgi:hypothetical protein|nr:hypothetical protein [Euryarchaeota archaeon]|tara:strand:+ start:4437 stop:4916 length:480 start_codon:yes stop_codon:yes gene_type:complete
MATVYSTAYNSIYQAVPSSLARANEIGGRVRVAYGVYEASSLASGDVINMFRLPQGARIIEGSLSHDALGSSTTLAVGHAAYTNSGGTAVGADGTHFKAAAASTSATGSVAVANTLALGKFELVDLDQEVKDNGFDVTVSMGGAAGTGTIALVMYYVVD